METCSPESNPMSYWLHRLQPLVRSNSDKEFIIVLCPNFGSDDETICHISASSITTFKSGEVLTDELQICSADEDSVDSDNESSQPELAISSEPLAQGAVLEPVNAQAAAKTCSTGNTRPPPVLCTPSPRTVAAVRKKPRPMSPKIHIPYSPSLDELATFRDQNSGKRGISPEILTPTGPSPVPMNLRPTVMPRYYQHWDGLSHGEDARNMDCLTPSTPFYDFDMTPLTPLRPKLHFPESQGQELFTPIEVGYSPLSTPLHAGWRPTVSSIHSVRSNVQPAGSTLHHSAVMGSIRLALGQTTTNAADEAIPTISIVEEDTYGEEMVVNISPSVEDVYFARQSLDSSIETDVHDDHPGDGDDGPGTSGQYVIESLINELADSCLVSNLEVPTSKCSPLFETNTAESDDMADPEEDTGYFQQSPAAIGIISIIPSPSLFKSNWPSSVHLETIPESLSNGF